MTRGTKSGMYVQVQPFSDKNKDGADTTTQQCRPSSDLCRFCMCQKTLEVKHPRFQQGKQNKNTQNLQTDIQAEGGAVKFLAQMSKWRNPTFHYNRREQRSQWTGGLGVCLPSFPAWSQAWVAFPFEVSVALQIAVKPRKGQERSCPSNTPLFFFYFKEMVVMTSCLHCSKIPLNIFKPELSCLDLF